MKKRWYILLTSSIFGFSMSAQTPYKAVVIAPVTDLVGTPLYSLYPGKSVEQSYAHLPVCEAKKVPGITCPRIHQLIFNQQVTVHETTAQEALVEVSSVFYTVGSSPVKHTRYWMRKKDLHPLHALAQNDLDKLPNNITHMPEKMASPTHKVEVKTTAHRQDPSPKQTNTNAESIIITLKAPFTDPVTKQIYSAGTQFVCNKNKKIWHRKHEVWVLDTRSKQFKKTYIPHKLVLAGQKRLPEQRIKQFVQLLREWTQQRDGFIPYVWGGCSFVSTQNASFKTVHTSINAQPATYFAFNNDTSAPKTGMDCANMIVRAAQICGIPFYYKNTATIKRYLHPLKKNQHLQNGDLIIINGHVMVVASVANNTFIEACSYFTGYGKLHEQALHKAFRGIRTYNDLIAVHHAKKRVARLNKAGVVDTIFPDCTLLKIRSVF